MLFEQITGQVIQCAMKVHTALGAGLFEEVYKVCLRHEISKQGFEVQSEVPIPLRYDGLEFEVGYRIDLLIENAIIVELKSVERILPLHRAQLLTYLKVTNFQVGLVINFNVPHLRDGILRVANTHFTSASPASSAL